MPIVEIETEPGVWERRDISFEERRQLLASSYPEQRFVKDEIVYIAHPLNMWCVVYGDSFDHVDWD
jgi:hypothetical protein